MTYLFDPFPLHNGNTAASKAAKRVLIISRAETFREIAIELGAIANNPEYDDITMTHEANVLLAVYGSGS